METLKDLSDAPFGAQATRIINKKLLSNVTTDKDIFYEDGVIRKSTLRQSAINDIKELSKEINLIKYSPEHHQLWVDNGSPHIYQIDIIRYIKKKFNITEEDLK